jgi:hypothetical protein
LIERKWPVRKVEAERLRRLVADLDADTFAVREAATRELAALGDVAAPALRAALASGPSAEMRVRAERLLRQLEAPVPSAARLRGARGVAVLEHAGTAEARRLLESLAKGTPEAPLTREAGAALARMTRPAPTRR